MTANIPVIWAAPKRQNGPAGIAMTDRRRMPWRLLVVFATVTAVVAAVVAIGYGSTTDGRPEGGDAVVAAVRSSAPVITALAERLERHVPTGPATTVSCEIVIVAMTLAGLVGPSRRRIGDVGDRWRRLLVGAPPAAV